MSYYNLKGNSNLKEYTYHTIELTSQDAKQLYSRKMKSEGWEVCKEEGKSGLKVTYKKLK
jgi:hypothetical protein